MQASRRIFGGSRVLTEQAGMNQQCIYMSLPMDNAPEREPLLSTNTSPRPSSLFVSQSVLSIMPSPTNNFHGEPDAKHSTEMDIKTNTFEAEDTIIVKSSHRQPPPYVASLTPEDREKAEKALLRKIDLRLIPPVIIMYILNYLDRNAIASARLGGLEQDLKLKGAEYQTCVSILFVGYILMQVPSNLLLNKLGKPSLYLPGAMIVWGIVSAATAGVHNFAGLVSLDLSSLCLVRVSPNFI